MQRFRIGAVTDIFSPDVGLAAAAMRELGMRGAELRTINGTNVLDAGNEDLERAVRILRSDEVDGVGSGSPLL